MALASHPASRHTPGVPALYIISAGRDNLPRIRIRNGEDIYMPTMVLAVHRFNCF